MPEEVKTHKSFIKPKGDILFEVSWEVCNKVGGIYTVLTTKARELVSYYGEHYYLVGPYFRDKLKGEFKEQPLPPSLKPIVGDLEKTGIRCHFGTWLIEGEPRVILIDCKDCWGGINEFKGKLWEWYGIDSLNTGFDFDEPVLWSHAVAKFLAHICERLKDKKIVAHFHEWLTGAALLYLKHHNAPIGTVFTTHATTLGRTYAFHNVNFYPLIKEVRSDEAAASFHIKAKHQLEAAVAQTADVCTTVSDITSLEVEHFLGRKVDFVLPNGMDTKKFLTFEEISIQHRIHRNKVREFLLFYFFPYYSFDLDETLFYFLVSRYEFRAKGIDVFIRSLGELNKRLVEAKSKKTIVAFVWVPTETSGINRELLENREYFQDIKDYLEESIGDTKNRLLKLFVEHKAVSEKTLFHKEFLFEIKKRLFRLEQDGVPSLSTHNVTDGKDLILQSFKENGLRNLKTDRVKVVFYPIYLTGHDGLINLSYQESLQACHLGIFPSFYEPWGYTPLEAASLGVAAITADLTGFGQFVEKIPRDLRRPGVSVIKRANTDDEETVRELAEAMYRFANYSRRERVENKISARAIAAQAGWDRLVVNYIEAHNAAIERMSH